MDVVRPYQLDDAQLEARMDEMVSVTFSDLTSQFMLLPRGNAFLTYEEFRDGYEALRLATKGFTAVTTETCWTALKQDARAFIVLRTILGVSPPEWQDLTAQETGSSLPSNTARSIDGKVKRDAAFFTSGGGSTALMVERVTDMLQTACGVVNVGVEPVPEGLVHRLDTPSWVSRAKMASARASVPSFASSATSIPRRAMATAALTAPPPGWVDTSSASVLRPSSSSRKEESALSMVMRSMRSLSMIAIVSVMAPPTVSIFIVGSKPASGRHHLNAAA